MWISNVDLDDVLEVYQKSLSIFGEKYHEDEECLDLIKSLMVLSIYQSNYFLKNWDDYITTSYVESDSIKKRLDLGVVIATGMDLVAAWIFQNSYSYLTDDPYFDKAKVDKEEHLKQQKYFENIYRRMKTEYSLVCNAWDDGHTLSHYGNSMHERIFVSGSKDTFCYKLFLATAYVMQYVFQMNIKNKNVQSHWKAIGLSQKSKDIDVFFNHNIALFLKKDELIKFYNDSKRLIDSHWDGYKFNSMLLKCMDRRDKVTRDDNDDLDLSWEDVSDLWGGSGGYFDH